MKPEKCPKCNGKLKYYHGLLGYESYRCVDCGCDIKDLTAEEGSQS